MARPIDRPLNWAAQHFAAARFAEAFGAYRAALAMDPADAHAHLGLAESLVAMGARHEGIEQLVDAGRRAAEAGRHTDVFALLGRALVHDPSRLELHLDIAESEAALGYHEAATERLEGLANAYIDAGKMDEATAVVEFIEAWNPSAQSEAETIEELSERDVLEALEELEEIELLEDDSEPELEVQTLPRIELREPMVVEEPAPRDATIMHPLLSAAEPQAAPPSASPKTRRHSGVHRRPGMRWTPGSTSSSPTEAKPAASPPSSSPTEAKPAASSPSTGAQPTDHGSVLDRIRALPRPKNSRRPSMTGTTGTTGTTGMGASASSAPAKSVDRESAKRERPSARTDANPPKAVPPAPPFNALTKTPKPLGFQRLPKNTRPTPTKASAATQPTQTQERRDSGTAPRRASVPGSPLAAKLKERTRARTAEVSEQARDTDEPKSTEPSSRPEGPKAKAAKPSSVTGLAHRLRERSRTSASGEAKSARARSA